MTNSGISTNHSEELVWEKPLLYKEEWLNTLGASDNGGEEFVTLPDPT